MIQCIYYINEKMKPYSIEFRDKIVFSERIHEGRVWNLAFTHEGKKIISGGDDGVVSILELDNLN
jgi:WD40 repeat protein